VPQHRTGLSSGRRDTLSLEGDEGVTLQRVLSEYSDPGEQDE